MNTKNPGYNTTLTQSNRSQLLKERR